MTLRDYFAGQALSKLVGIYGGDLLGSMAYSAADSMLKARAVK